MTTNEAFVEAQQAWAQVWKGVEPILCWVLRAIWVLWYGEISDVRMARAWGVPVRTMIGWRRKLS